MRGAVRLGQWTGGAPLTSVTIDLGLVPAYDDDDPGPRPVSPVWGVLLCLLLVSVLGGAAGVFSPIRVVARFPVGVGSFALDADTLYTMGFGTLTAYDERTGAQRWTAPDLGYAQETRFGPVAVLSADFCSAGGSVATSGYDVRTGALLWTRPGVPLASSSLVLVDSTWSDRCGGQTVTGTLRFIAVDPATGATRWQIAVPPGSEVSIDDRTESWAALRSPAGAVTVVDLRTGRTSAPVDSAVSSGYVRLTADGDLLVEAHSSAVLPGVSGSTAGVAAALDLIAYDRYSLSVRWRRTVNARGVTAQDCGPYLCVATDRQTVAVDPSDGAVHWTGPASTFVELSGLLLAGHPPNRTDIYDNVGISVRDPKTGRPTVTLPDWTALTGAGTGRLLMGQVGYANTLLAWLVDGHTDFLGVVDGRLDSCLLSGPAVACHSNEDEVWLLHIA